MLDFFWFYIWNLTIIPMCIFFTIPFHSMRWYTYTKYLAFDTLKIKLSITSDEQLIKHGYILANHRSFTDFGIDPLLADSAIIGRRLACIIMFWNVMIGYADNRIFSFVRGKETRSELFHRIKKHFALRNRILFFPEGTRLKYTNLSSKEELKSYLKYGILKEIYYDKAYPVQIQISSNKELVINEHKLYVNYGDNVKTHRTRAIYPTNYDTENDFYDAIATEWYDAWVKTHI